jgi:predicted glutamine amidotransferase
VESLFGLTAAPRRVHASFWLLETADARRRIPDGVGLGYFAPVVGPVLDKEPLPVHQDPAFTRAAKHVSSVTFVSHIRYATAGARTTENTQPFAQDGMLFAHNGMLGDLDALEAELGRDMRFVGGDTDSERYFALIAKAVRAHHSLGRGISAAVSWIVRSLPVQSLNFVLATAEELWAFRYPETEPLFLRERTALGEEGERELHQVSATMRVRVPDLEHRPSVLVASEPLDDSPGWRALEAGELVHVGRDLSVRSSTMFDREPAHPIRLGDAPVERVTHLR